jgi:hypothetical protein
VTGGACGFSKANHQFASCLREDKCVTAHLQVRDKTKVGSYAHTCSLRFFTNAQRHEATNLPGVFVLRDWLSSRW